MDIKQIIFIHLNIDRFKNNNKLKVFLNQQVGCDLFGYIELNIRF